MGNGINLASVYQERFIASLLPGKTSAFFAIIVVFQIFLAASSVTINGIMSIANSARFDSNYLVGGWFFLDKKCSSRKGGEIHN